MRLEEKLASWLATTSPSSAAAEAALRVLRGPVDWEALLSFSVREGIAAVLYRNLRAEPYAPRVPAAILGRLRSLYLGNAARNLHHFRTLEETLLALDREGIRAGVLKGPHLATEAYPDPGLRPMGDLDLLVGPGDVLRASAVLGRLGFAAAETLPPSAPSAGEYRNSALFNRPDAAPGGVVHLHWHIVNAAFPFPFYRGVGPGEIWSEMTPWRFRGAPAWVPSPRFLPAFLAEHALKHSFTPLIHLVDLVQVRRSAHVRATAEGRPLVDHRPRGGVPPPPGGLHLSDHRSLSNNRGNAPFGLGDVLAFAERVASDVLGWEGGGEAASVRKPALDLACRLTASGWRRPGLCHVAYLALSVSPSQRIRLLKGLWFPPREMLARLNGIRTEEVSARHYVRRMGRGVIWGMRFVKP